MRSYGQFCPVAQAAELLAERWTPLVLRELLSGEERFGQIHRGVPLMSSSLLTKRLRTLEDAGIVTRHDDGSATRYLLTDAGEALRPVIMAMGEWGRDWGHRDLLPTDLDSALLMWDLHRRVDRGPLDGDRTVIEFRLSTVEAGRDYYWLKIEDDVEVCLQDPGFHIDLVVDTDMDTMVGVWLGRLDVRDAIAGGRLRLDGPTHLQHRFPDLLRLSVFAQPD